MYAVISGDLYLYRGKGMIYYCPMRRLDNNLLT